MNQIWMMLRMVQIWTMSLLQLQATLWVPLEGES